MIHNFKATGLSSLSLIPPMFLSCRNLSTVLVFRLSSCETIMQADMVVIIALGVGICLQLKGSSLTVNH